MAFPVTYIYSVIRNVKYGCIHRIGCVSEYLYFGRGGGGGGWMGVDNVDF